MADTIRWSTLVKLCGRPWVLSKTDPMQDKGCYVTIFHGDGSVRNGSDWGECRSGFCNVIERVVFPVPVPNEHRDKRIIGINYTDIITETELKSGFLPVLGLTLKQLLGYARRFEREDFELLCAGAEVHCLAFHKNGVVSIDDADRDELVEED